MLLESLIELRGRLEDIPPSDHVTRPVAWIIELDAEGRFLGWVSTSTGPKDKGLDDVIPTSRRTSGVLAHLFIDKADYVLGLKIDKKGAVHTPRRQEAFVELVREFLAQASEQDAPTVRAVLAFLTGDQFPLAVEARDAKLVSADWIGFRVDGAVLPHRMRAAQKFWMARAAAAGPEEGGARTFACAVCGQEGPALATHPVSIRLDGEDAALISANKNAFESFGLKRSEICPVCATCAREYGEALRFVLSDASHRFRSGGVTYGYWLREEESGFDAFTFLNSPAEADVKALLAAPFRPAGAAANLDPNRFYALGVTSNKRLVIRDWITTTVPEVRRKLAEWFDRQSLRVASGPHAGQMAEAHGVFALASSLVLDIKRISPRVVPALVHAALLGTPVPFDLLAMALRRAAADADNRLTVTRAKVIRMALNDHFRRQQPDRQELLVHPELNPDDHRPGYLCGRLFATLEAVQYAALGSTNTTIADRFFGTASSAPASVFGRLMRGSQAHLAKLRKNKGGTHVALQRQIEDIASRLPDFPRTLSLQDQGLFALGYYHQRAEDARGRLEHKNARAAAADANDDLRSDDQPAAPAQASLV